MNTLKKTVLKFGLGIYLVAMSFLNILAMEEGTNSHKKFNVTVFGESNDSKNELNKIRINLDEENEENEEDEEKEIENKVKKKKYKINFGESNDSKNELNKIRINLDEEKEIGKKRKKKKDKTENISTNKIKSNEINNEEKKQDSAFEKHVNDCYKKCIGDFLKSALDYKLNSNYSSINIEDSVKDTYLKKCCINCLKIILQEEFREYIEKNFSINSFADKSLIKDKEKVDPKNFYVSLITDKWELESESESEYFVGFSFVNMKDLTNDEYDQIYEDLFTKVFVNVINEIANGSFKNLEDYINLVNNINKREKYSKYCKISKEDLIEFVKKANFFTEKSYLKKK